MKILISGGAGFIGSHLAERLCENSRLTLFDNLRRNSLEGVPALKSHPHVRLVRGSVLEPKKLARAMSGADTVLHLAAIAGVSSYYREPLEVLRVNLLGTVNVLEAALKAGVKKFIYLSTSEVFGSEALWVSEDQPHRIGPVSDKRWSYATSKLASEQFVMRYGEAFGMACTILRPFNIYGPRQTGEGAVSNFCAAAAAGKDLTVYGDGSAIRAWCYVSDFVDAVEAALARKGKAGMVFNIGNPNEVETTTGLARRVAGLAGVSVRSQTVAQAEVRARIPRIDKARKILGFSPKIGLEEGLRRTLQWRRSRPA